MSTIRRTTRAPSCLLAAALGFASSGAPAQPVPVAVPSEAPSSILLRSRVMDPRGRMPEGIGEGEFGRAHILASFDRAVTRREVLELKKTFDIQVLDSCPVNAYVLSVPQRLLQGEALLRSLPPGTRVAPLQPTDKLSPRLMLRGPRYPPKVPPYTARRGDLVEAIVLFHGDLREEDAQTKLLSQQRARPLQRMSAINGWRIALPEEQIARLAERDSVKWIEEGPPPPHDDNNEVRGVDGVNADAVQAAMGSSTGGGGYGLTGQGVVIAQWETKNASVAHKDLAPRVTLGDTIVPPDSRFYRYADVAADAQYNGGEPFYLDVDDSLTVTPGDWRAANIGTLAAGTVLAGDADVSAAPTRLRELQCCDVPFEAFLDSAPAYNRLFDPGEAIYTDLDDAKGGEVSAGDIRRTPVARNGAPLVPYAVGSIVQNGDEDAGAPLNRYPGASPHHHSTHVAGTMIGAGTDHRGVAPRAELLSFHVKRLGVGVDVSKLPDEHARAIAAGATIANNSWGVQDYYCALQDSGYGAQSAMNDALASGYNSDGTPATERRMLLVFSAGNAYGLDCSSNASSPQPLVPPELWGTVQATNSAKDVLTVANAAPGNASAGVPAVLSDDSLRGPTGPPVTPLLDGRLKPDVSAPGRERVVYHGVKSTVPPRDHAPQGTYAGDGGTSMAAPAVSGSAALLTEWYRKDCAATGPTPDLLRATIVHTARDIKTFLKTDAPGVDPATFPGPDYGSGYGMVDVANAVKVMMHHRRGALSDAGPIDYPLSVGAVPELKVTLAWDDPPYSCLCAVSATHGLLQNDLDLVLVDPAGNKHAPWRLDPEHPTVKAQTSGPITGDISPYLDHRNTIEQIVVQAPMPGAWKIRVSASQMNPVFEEQSFAIVSELLSTVNGDPAYCP